MQITKVKAVYKGQQNSECDYVPQQEYLLEVTQDATGVIYVSKSTKDCIVKYNTLSTFLQDWNDIRTIAN